MPSVASSAPLPADVDDADDAAVPGEPAPAVPHGRGGVLASAREAKAGEDAQRRCVTRSDWMMDIWGVFRGFGWTGRYLHPNFCRGATPWPCASDRLSTVDFS